MHYLYLSILLLLYIYVFYVIYKKDNKKNKIERGWLKSKHDKIYVKYNFNAQHALYNSQRVLAVPT